MTVKEKAGVLLQEAKDLAVTSKSWADFSNALFDQRTGLVSKTFVDLAQRQSFYDTIEYDKINELLLELIKKYGVADGASPTKSGKFLVRIPKTLHTVLELEAKQEGVSLNQLALTKLSVKLTDATDLANALLVEAFTQIHDGFSSERIVLDPDYNARFLERCHDLGLTQNDYVLNLLLYSIPKTGKGMLPPSTKRTEFRDYDSYAFASEIAVRLLQRADGISLDRILCNPSLRQRFDEAAQRLAPEQPALKLRWAALNLRKTHRLRPGDARLPLFELESATPIGQVKLDRIPADPGTYAFYDEQRPIFAGETANLRKRVEHHLEHSARQGLPTWLGILSEKGLILKYAVVPGQKQEVRLAWLRQFINRERPILNYQRAA